MRTFALTFTEQELGYLSRVLGSQPYAEVANLIAKINTQVAGTIEEDKKAKG